MAIPDWQQILTRGQETVAVWEQHGPTFTVGGLALAGHTAEVEALAPAGQTVETEQEVLDDARAARDGVVDELGELSVRLCRKLDGELAPGDPYHRDLADVRALRTDRLGEGLTRAQRTVALWDKYNARAAAATPPGAALTVGGKTAAQYAALAAALPAKSQLLENQDSAMRDRRHALRALATTVDRGNKRWYAAWQGEFPAGTPEGDALSQITTEGGGSGSPGEGEPPEPEPGEPVPGAASIASGASVSGGIVTLVGLTAEGATSFKVQLAPESAGTGFADYEDNVPGPDYTFTPSADTYQARVAGRNGAGLGPWSAAVSFTVA
jgi:hypothetical protein